LPAFAKSLAASNLSHGAMASNPEFSRECLQFPPVSRRPNVSEKASFGREPQPQAEGYDGNRADAAEPKGCEPQQALCQRSWVLRFAHQ
jgi:hypothetical protein